MASNSRATRNKNLRKEGIFLALVIFQREQATNDAPKHVESADVIIKKRTLRKRRLCEARDIYTSTTDVMHLLFFGAKRVGGVSDTCCEKRKISAEACGPIKSIPSPTFQGHTRAVRGL